MTIACERVDELLVVSLALRFGNADGNAHAEAGDDALHRAIDLEGALGVEASGETGANPKGVAGFDEHAAGADIASFAGQDGGAPFDFEVGFEGIARSPSAFKAAA